MGKISRELGLCPGMFSGQPLIALGMFVSHQGGCSGRWDSGMVVCLFRKTVILSPPDYDLWVNVLFVVCWVLMRTYTRLFVIVNKNRVWIDEWSIMCSLCLKSVRVHPARLDGALQKSNTWVGDLGVRVVLRVSSNDGVGIHLFLHRRRGLRGTGEGSCVM